MSTCTKWIDNVVITCVDWAEQIDVECTDWADEGSAQCSSWADEGSNQCSSWKDQGSNQCSSWKDQGSNQCSSWADEGSNHCCTWAPCSWFCDAFYWVAKWVCKAYYWVANWVCQAWYWVANWVCQAWYWVAKWVCKAWYWVAKWVCKAFAWVIKAICTVFSWVVNLICVAWDTLKCAILAIFSRGKAKNKIEHIFVLMLENRAFDHMLGFSNISGIDAVSGNPTTVNGANPSVNTNIDPTNGHVVPVSTPADFTLKNIDKDPGHEFPDTLVALCGAGAVYNPVLGGYPPIDNSGFIQSYVNDGSTTPERIMTCYTADQLPVMNKLATEFAICDNWFSSLPGPTWPNRFFLLAATSGGLDGSPSSWDVATSTIVDGYVFDNGNIFDSLDDNCIDWSIFEGDDFPVSFALKGMNLNLLQGRFKDFDDFASDVNDPGFDQKFVFIEPRYSAHKFDITGPGDFACGNSMHPLDDVTRGEKLIKDVYEAIRNSPLWEKSMLLITFDEHGGFYDHVKPPAAVPPGDLANSDYVQFNFKFDQLGVRVPAIVVSPFTKKGLIDHTVYDHTSMLATTEKIFGIGSLTNRDQAANDYLHLFSLASPRTDAPTMLPDPANSGFKCEEDEESREALMAIRSELVMAKTTGRYRENAVMQSKPTDAQFNFAHVALRKVLMVSEYPERKKWIADFKSVKTGLDAAIFMTEIKLKLNYSVDIKKMLRESEKAQKLAAIRNWRLNRKTNKPG